jgi:predicted nucleic acid-binding protein
MLQESYVTKACHFGVTQRCEAELQALIERVRQLDTCGHNSETHGCIMGRAIRKQHRDAVDYWKAASASRATNGVRLQRETAEAHRAGKPAQVFGFENSS